MCIILILKVTLLSLIIAGYGEDGLWEIYGVIKDKIQVVKDVQTC